MTLRHVAVLMVLGLVPLTACSDSTPGVIHQLENRREAVSRLQPYDDFSDLLPNRLYRMGEGPQFQMSEAVVLDSFGSVAPGKAFSAEDSARGVEVDFDSADAAWRTYHVQIVVDQVLAGRLPAQPVTMGLALGGDADPDGVAADLAALGKVVVLLRHSAVFDYAPGVLGSTEDGAFIGQVDSAGRVTFPVLSGEEAKALTDGLTVARITAAAGAPGRSIQLDASGATILSERSTAG